MMEVKRTPSQRDSVTAESLNAMACLAGHRSLRKITSLSAEQKQRRNLILIDLTEQLDRLHEYLKESSKYPAFDLQFAKSILDDTQQFHIRTWSEKSLQNIFQVAKTKFTAFIDRLIRKGRFDEFLLQSIAERVSLYLDILFNI